MFAWITGSYRTQPDIKEKYPYKKRIDFHNEENTKKEEDTEFHLPPSLYGLQILLNQNPYARLTRHDNIDTGSGDRNPYIIAGYTSNQRPVKIVNPHRLVGTETINTNSLAYRVE